MNSSVLRWGILGAGRIAEQFLTELRATRPGLVTGVASSDVDRATALARGFEGVEAFPGYDALLRDPDIDAVYVATLHPQHEALIRAAVSAGKHVLCEKPITVSAETARFVFDAAADAGVALVEAMQYRFQPQTLLLRRLLEDGEIGVPRHVDVSCAFATPFDPHDRLFDPRLGGGAILDVGCYTMSFARMIAGWVAQDDGVEPVALSGGGHLGESGVDDWAIASLVFADGFSAHIRTGIRLDDDMHAVVYGSHGYLRIADPWTPGKAGVIPRLVVCRVGREPEIIQCEPGQLFGAEVDAVADAVETGESRLMSARDSVATMRTLDRWRAAVGA